MRKRGRTKSVNKLVYGIVGVILSFLAYSYAMEQAKLSGEGGPVKLSIPFGSGTDFNSVLVDRVVDGDTLKLSNGERVRLIGIDTPELHLSDKLTRDAQRSKTDAKTIQAMGRQSYEFTKKLVEGKRVKLEFDVERRDRYQRLLAYVYLEDGTFVNAEIVKQGYASLMTYPPNVKYVDLFESLYREARENRRGLWQ